MKEYLKTKTKAWLDAEIEQAHALALDSRKSEFERVSAMAAAIEMVGELAKRKK
jgi:hypothetical protein